MAVDIDPVGKRERDGTLDGAERQVRALRREPAIGLVRGERPVIVDLVDQEDKRRRRAAGRCLVVRGIVDEHRIGTRDGVVQRD